MQSWTELGATNTGKHQEKLAILNLQKPFSSMVNLDLAAVTQLRSVLSKSFTRFKFLRRSYSLEEIIV